MFSYSNFHLQLYPNALTQKVMSHTHTDNPPTDKEQEKCTWYSHGVARVYFTRPVENGHLQHTYYQVICYPQLFLKTESLLLVFMF